MQNSLLAFSNKLIEESKNVKNNLEKLNKAFFQQSLINLNSEELKVNSIHFFRSMGSADTSTTFYCYKSQDEIKEIETDLTNSMKYLTTSHIEFESFIEEELSDEELDNFFIKCEQKYIQWFTRIWHSTNCHENERIKFILIENNSGKSFDLNTMEWVNDAFQNQVDFQQFYSKESNFDNQIAMERILLNYE